MYTLKYDISVSHCPVLTVEGSNTTNTTLMYQDEATVTCRHGDGYFTPDHNTTFTVECRVNGGGQLYLHNVQTCEGSNYIWF